MKKFFKIFLWSLLVLVCVFIIFCIGVAVAPDLNEEMGDTDTLSGTIYTETIPDINFSMDMVYVHEGTFDMGATREQIDYDYAEVSEKSVHKVILSSYHIGKYEITQAQYEAVMGDNPSYYKGYDLPVENVTWHKAKEFCDKLSTKTGKKYALPTEEQWEFAARGGNKSKRDKYNGCSNLGEVAWYCDNSGYHTHAVGTKMPNELGIYDMSGNVSEWCEDWFDYYKGSDVLIPTSKGFRSIRGGSFASYHKHCRLSRRCSNLPNQCDRFHGFRVVCLP